MAFEDRRGGPVVIELVRLAIVLALTALGFSVGEGVDRLVGRGDPQATRLLTSVLGALFGYLLGGAAGRGLLAGVDQAQQRLRRVDAAVLVSTVIGATLMALLAVVIIAPLLFLPGRAVTLPLAAVIVLGGAYLGGHLGASRGGDLSRFVGVRGRLEVASPSRGAGTKIVDTSALIDSRLVEVCRAGFLDGRLVVPAFVLSELQALADLEDRRKRTAGVRGLEALQTLQNEHLAVVEVSDEELPDGVAVDDGLVALAERRDAALLTVDANLARVAEIRGVRVLSLHVLAESMRPPVIPGDRIEVQIMKPGTEPGQGVGYLPDGSMVVVEDAADEVGGRILAEVTAITSNRQGRMLFAQRTGDSQ